MRELKTLPHDREKTTVLELPVFEYEEDMFGNLKLSNLLRKLQEMASYDVLKLGFTHDKLEELGVIHVLVWNSIEIVRDLHVGEKLVFFTSPREPKGSRMYRDIWAEDEEGNRVVEASTIWACINPINRTILEPSDSIVPYKLQEKNIQIEDAKKIRRRKNMPFLGTRETRFSDMDVNRHMNNCQYADLFCDFSGVDFEKYQVGCFRINYRKEIYMGDLVELYGEVEETDEGLRAYMCGQSGDTVCFLIEADLFPVER